MPMFMVSHETVAHNSYTNLIKNFILLSQSFIICELLFLLGIQDAITIWGKYSP